MIGSVIFNGRLADDSRQLKVGGHDVPKQQECDGSRPTFNEVRPDNVVLPSYRAARIDYASFFEHNRHPGLHFLDAFDDDLVALVETFFNDAKLSMGSAWFDLAAFDFLILSN